MSLEPLRIAFATPEYVTEKYFDGGLSNYLHRVAKALAGMGHDIHVLTLSEIDDAEFDHEGVKVHRLTTSKWWKHLDSSTRYRLPTTILYLDLSVKINRLLKRIDAQHPLHLVQFPNYSCCGLVSMCFSSITHVLRASSYLPVWNDAGFVKETLDSRIVRRLEGLQFQLSKDVFAPSNFLQKILATDAKLTDVRVIRSPFYLETTEWDTSIYDRFLKGKKYLLFFGRFQLQKGIHTLAQALPRVLAECPDAHAALVGRDLETELGPSMAAYAREQCGDSVDRLIVIEKLPHHQLYPVIAGAQLVVIPSLVENFPNACLEAMGLGKVVIGTNSSSFGELITEDRTGFLVPPNNSDALADKIISAWHSPKLEEIGAAAQQKTLELLPERTVESLIAYYREVLASSSGQTTVPH